MFNKISFFHLISRFIFSSIKMFLNIIFLLFRLLNRVLILISLKYLYSEITIIFTFILNLLFVERQFYSRERRSKSEKKKILFSFLLFLFSSQPSKLMNSIDKYNENIEAKELSLIVLIYCCYLYIINSS